NVSFIAGSNRSAAVSAAGATPGYIYLLSLHDALPISAINLTAGTYTVTVTDVNGCSITSTAVVAQPTILAANGSTLANVSCFAGSNGSAAVAAAGGTPGYSYLWSPSGGNSVTANNLTA